jgi:membrane-associated phospholipid phosphatase
VNGGLKLVLEPSVPGRRSRSHPDGNNNDDKATQAGERGGWFVVALCVLALVALRLPLGHAGSLDTVLLHAINATMARLPLIDFQARLLNEDIAQVIVAAAAVALWFRRSSSNIVRTRVLLAFLVFFPTYGSARILQHLGHRMRPMIDQPLQPLGDAGVYNSIRDQMSHWGSFPSDHSALLAIATLIAFMVGRRTGFIALILALYSCLFRIGYGYHWPSDIAGGIILGTAFCLLGLRLQPLLRPVFTSVFSFMERRPGISAAMGTIVATEFCDGFRYLTFFARVFLRTRLFH